MRHVSPRAASGAPDGSLKILLKIDVRSTAADPIQGGGEIRAGANKFVPLFSNTSVRRTENRCRAKKEISAGIKKTIVRRTSVVFFPFERNAPFSKICNDHNVSITVLQRTPFFFGTAPYSTQLLNIHILNSTLNVHLV